MYIKSAGINFLGIGSINKNSQSKHYQDNFFQFQLLQIDEVEMKMETAKKSDELHKREQTCQCLKPTFSSKHGSTYLQLGFGCNEDDLKKNVLEKTKLNQKDILFQEIEYIGVNIKNYPCNPATEILETKNKKLVVLFKKNKLFQCQEHVFIVVALIVNNSINSQHGDRLRNYFVKEIIPNCHHQQRSSCTFNKSLLPAKCDCQGKDKVSEGFSVTFGCTRTSFSGGKCRFNKKLQKKPLERFQLQGGTRKKLETFEKHCINTADKMSHILKQYAPDAFANMTIYEPNSCRLGKSAFTSMSIVSSFTAHQHIDKNDVRDGATSMLTLLKKEGEGVGTQFHCLPGYQFKGSMCKGVSFKLEDCSTLIEVAAMEVHCSTPILNANGLDPDRMGLVFFTHSGLNIKDHGFSLPRAAMSRTPL